MSADEVWGNADSLVGIRIVYGRGRCIIFRRNGVDCRGMARLGRRASIEDLDASRVCLEDLCCVVASLPVYVRGAVSTVQWESCSAQKWQSCMRVSADL